MNSTRDFVRPAVAGLSAGRVFRAMPRSTMSTLTRAGLPVVSNRAFVSAWMARREKLTGTPQLARGC